MILATLDTNILASGFRKLEDPTSTPSRIVGHWIVGNFELACSEFILDELSRTLNNRYFRRYLSEHEISNALRMVRDESTMVPITVDVSGITTHPEDDLVLACAVSAGARYLVTGDRALLNLGEYLGVTIISARDFLEVLEQI